MGDPYRIDPRRMRAQEREASERQVITLQDDSAKPPPTVGTAPWQAILFGPALGQPSGEESRVSPWFGRILLALVVGAGVLGLVRLLNRGF